MKRWVLFLALVGCGGVNNNQNDMGGSSDQSAEVADVSEVAVATSALVATTTSGSSGTTAMMAADNAAASVPMLMQPAGCVTTKTTLVKVVYTFTNCTGPFGLAKVNGTLTVTYSLNAGSIGASYGSTNLTVGSTKLQLDGSATYSETGATKTVTYTPSGSATGPRGHTVSLAGSIAMTWTTTCLSITGSFTATVDTVSFTIAATSYQECTNACPAAGGALSFTSGGETWTLTFDGTTTAHYSSSTGKSGSLPLFCG